MKKDDNTIYFKITRNNLDRILSGEKTHEFRNDSMFYAEQFFYFNDKKNIVTGKKDIKYIVLQDAKRNVKVNVERFGLVYDKNIIEFREIFIKEYGEDFDTTPFIQKKSRVLLIHISNPTVI